MESIRIQRLRCLSDTGEVKIRPITVLLGENNSGKSTFLRFFPLLRQSVEARTTGPILWNGRLVDFGRYQDAHQKDVEEGISFQFQFKIQARSRAYFPTNTKLLNDLDIALELKIIEDKERDTTIIHGLKILFADSQIEINFTEDEKISKFQINSLDILKTCNKLGYIQKSDIRAILPVILESNKIKDLKQEKIELFSRSRRSYFPSISLKLIEKLKNICHRFTSESTILEIANSLGFGSSLDMLENFKEEDFGLTTWKKTTKNWTVNTKEFQEIRDLIIASYTSFLIERCDNILESFFMQTSYMGPIRANAERYYRVQDLAVDEVDPQGGNLVMFLRNLTKEERKDFTTWSLKNFGFGVSIEPSLGHISVYIQPQNSQDNVNMADAGFGFSQILPVITQLWLMTEYSKYGVRRRNVRTLEIPKIFTIEQPELHLHPRLQGILTEAFVSSIKATREEGIDLRLIIETHSEVLINKLGHLVADRQIDPEDINIALFEKSKDSQETKVRFAHFDEEGYLSEDWPLGFFDMDLM